MEDTTIIVFAIGVIVLATTVVLAILFDVTRDDDLVLGRLVRVRHPIDGRYDGMIVGIRGDVIIVERENKSRAMVMREYVRAR